MIYVSGLSLRTGKQRLDRKTPSESSNEAIFKLQCAYVRAGWVHRPREQNMFMLRKNSEAMCRLTILDPMNVALSFVSLSQMENAY